MRIQYQRTGGFAGIKLSGKIDLEDLDEEIAQKIQHLLDESDFFDLPEHLQSDDSTRDQFNYTITVESKKGHHSVTFCQPPNKELSELSDLLFRLVRRRPSSRD